MVRAVKQPAADDAAVIDETSVAFVGRWRGLVSTTNWEKGRIICEWREALKESGAAPQEYSDEAWSRRIGQVSGQHAGRLRRVYERFQGDQQSYNGLYWSHFQTALDWSDAEMWLEGAVQNDWSVSEMRARRWETLGGKHKAERDEEIVEAEFDEDADPEAAVAEVRDPEDEAVATSKASARERSRRKEDDDDSEADSAKGVPFDADESDYPAESPSAPVRPFEHLPELPDDLAEAFESFKLAILHHKLAGWREVSREGVLQSLEALKKLALTPADA